MNQWTMSHGVFYYFVLWKMSVAFFWGCSIHLMDLFDTCSTGQRKEIILQKMLVWIIITNHPMSDWNIHVFLWHGGLHRLTGKTSSGERMQRRQAFLAYRIRPQILKRFRCIFHNHRRTQQVVQWAFNTLTQAWGQHPLFVLHLGKRLPFTI